MPSKSFPLHLVTMCVNKALYDWKSSCCCVLFTAFARAVVVRMMKLRRLQGFLLLYAAESQFFLALRGLENTGIFSKQMQGCVVRASFSREA
jgi:hypothetical protein